MAGFRTRGQPAALASVERAVRLERPPHALTLVGPAGVGKTTLGLDLAAGLLCLAEDSRSRPCRACAACRKVDHGNHPDLHRLAPTGAGGQITIGAARALATDLALLPHEGRWRVCLVEAAHRLNEDAQNALLKLLEEPPAGAVLVLCVDDESAMLETVRSRCARLRLGLLDAPTIAELLVEESLADPPRAATIARAADGRPGLALALARAPQAMLTEDQLLRRLLDLLDADRRTRLAAVPELLADAAALAEVAEPAAQQETAVEPTSGRQSAAERRRAALRLVGAWRLLGRDLAIAAGGPPSPARRAAFRRLELLEELEAAAAELDPLLMAAFLSRLDGLATALEGYANPELVVDVLVLAWPRTRRAA